MNQLYAQILECSLKPGILPGMMGIVHGILSIRINRIVDIIDGHPVRQSQIRTKEGHFSASIEVIKRNCPGSPLGLREAQFGDQRLGVPDQCLKQVPALFSGG